MKFARSRIQFFRSAAATLVIWASVIGVAFAHGEEDHGVQPAGSATATGSIPIARAERNIDTEAGKFVFRIERYPADPRTGELVQMAARILEKVEGGFGSNEPVPIEDAVVSLAVNTAEGVTVAENIPVTFEKGLYKADYTFSNDGNYKIVFSVATKDGRSFSADFPVSVVNAPIRWTFWLGLLFLGLISFGIVGAVFYSYRSEGDRNKKIKRLVPLTALALLFFVFGVFGLAFFWPPRETRAMGNFEPTGEPSINAADTGLVTVLTIPKESQILFGIKTEPVASRQITSGLNVTGVVRSRPDARAVVVPPVAGRIVLREGVSLGSAVGRGDEIGYVEQVLDVPGQVGLEQQRLDLEGKRLELRNTVLQLQAQQAEQRAKAQQARTQLAQANRELRRSTNLVEVGAAPRKRLEEAQTAVKVAEQEVGSAEQQVRLLDGQISQTKAGETSFSPQRVNQPTKTFPLTSPVSGIVNEIKATSGQVVETGFELMSVVNLSSVLVEAQVFEGDLRAVRESSRARFRSAALGDEVYTAGTPDGEGRLISIGQTVNEQTRTVPVVYEMKNPLNRLKDGMFVEITIDTSGDRQVLAVPKQAVVTEQGQTFVFVFDGGERFEKRPVVLGAEGADYYEVRSGLEEGERVVIEGIYQLRSTQPTA